MKLNFNKKNDKGEKNYAVPVLVMIAGCYMVDNVVKNVCKMINSVTKTRHGVIEKEKE